MSRVSLDGLEPGMRTARPVVNKSGMVLLGEDTELSAELIDRIRNMDVDAVWVHGSSKPSLPLEEMRAAIDSRFRLVVDDPVMTVIKAALVKHIEALYE